MFKENNQPEIFTFEADLEKKQRDKLDDTKEKWFNRLIFRNIREVDFRPLYSNNYSRPNVPVNMLVSALIFKELKGWSFDELIENVMFDLRMKVAIGLPTISEMPFVRATLFNFQNRMLAYENESGINLIETVFDNLTKEQLAQLKIKTDIQRTDSTLVSSNIKRYGRVQLIVETLLRLERILEEDDKKKYYSSIQEYSKYGSEKYIYKLSPADIPHELQKLGELYHLIYNQIKDKYSDNKIFRIFERVYQEHFVEVQGTVQAISSKELVSGTLQSPDDEDATFRKKREEKSKGFTVNGTETANPENPIQLLTDTVVNKNNKDDSTILNERIDIIVDKTPDLKELHTDGGYGSEANDLKFEKLEINQVNTESRGRTSDIEKKIEQTEETPAKYSVECPNQKIESSATKTRNKAQFDLNKCNECPLKNQCPIFKNNGKYYFDHSDFLNNQRNRNIDNIPEERQKIRPNVEATMKEFKCRTKNGKLKIRGIFKTSLWALLLAIGINFGRIYRFLKENGVDFGSFFAFFIILVFRFIFEVFLKPIFALKILFEKSIRNIQFSLSLKF